MRAVQYYEPGDANVLSLEEIEQPSPAPNEILVEIRAASVNPADIMFREAGTAGTPKTAGSDLAGVITETGSAVDEYSNGDRVFATGLHADRFTGGSFAEYAAIPTDLVGSLPEKISFKQGAAIALVGVTAWRALIDHGDLKPGETAFIHGGNGGVGHIAVGLGTAMGARVVATARPEYHNAIREFGASTVIDYTSDDLLDTAKKAADGANIVLDLRPSDYFSLDAEIAAFGGNITIISGESLTLTNIAAARSKELDIHLISMTNMATHSEMPNIGPILDRLGRVVAREKLEIAIDRTYSLKQAPEAQQAVMNDSILGKVVVVP